MKRQLWRERVGLPFQDGASFLGGTTLLLCLAMAWLGVHSQAGDAALAGACAAVPLLGCSRLRLPRSLALRVVLLSRVAARLRIPGVGLRLVWRSGMDAQGKQLGPSEPRLRILPARPHHGLLRIDVMVDTRPGAQALVLCAVARTASTAAHALSNFESERIEKRLSASGKRTLWAVSTVDLARDLEQLLSALAAHEQRALEGVGRDTTREAA